MNTGETIALIKAFGNGGGSSLPSVTSSDNGKVLTVEDGAWAAQGDIVINAARTGTNVDFGQITLTNLPSIADVEKLYMSGKGIVLNFNDAFKVRLAPAEKDVQSDVSYYNFNARCLDFDGFEQEYFVTLYNNDGNTDYDAWRVSFGRHGKFYVTLTPTAEDYSGTMDYTVAEINAAYEAGMEIWANISAMGKNLYIPLKMASTDGEYQYPSFDFCAYDISNDLMILAFTEYTNDGTKQTYSTSVYSLTPAS